MQKTYLVTGNRIDKDSGKPVSAIAEIIKGVSKEGQPYAYADTKAWNPPIDGTYPIGTILTGSLSLSIATQEQDEPQQRGLKLSTSK